MDNVRKMLDEVKVRNGVTTDYALAKTLDLPRQRISDYYKGDREPDAFACLKIAENLGKSLDEVQTAVKLDTEKNEKRRLVWLKHFEKIGGIAASFMIAGLALVIMIVTSPNADAQTQACSAEDSSNTNYTNQHPNNRCCETCAKNRSFAAAAKQAQFLRIDA